MILNIASKWGRQKNTKHIYTCAGSRFSSIHAIVLGLSAGLAKVFGHGKNNRCKYA